MKTIFLLLFPMVLMAQQTKGVVKDSLTGKPVPYVNIWIENENSGTTADEDGNFAVKTTNADKTIVFSAVSYETKRVKLTGVKKVLLQPVLARIESASPSFEFTKSKTIGDYKPRNVQLTYGNHGVPWMLARKFTFDDTLTDTPYITQVSLLTDSHNEKMVFNLRLFTIGDDGKPDYDLVSQNIFVTVERGKESTVVDLKPYMVKVPKKGFFVAVEWLMISQNVKTWYDRRPMQWKDYDPGIGMLPVEKNSTWAYRFGKWQEFGKNTEDVKGYKDKFVALAVKVTLSN
jgi:uncharacterized protein YbaA (DUF1428 family)